MAFFRLVPNLTIMAPKDFKELEDMLEFAVKLNKPVIIRYPRGGEDSKVKFERHENIELGKAEVLKKEILRQYRSVRQFAIEMNIPYSTLVTALDRGIDGMAYGTVIKMCDKLRLNPVDFSSLERDASLGAVLLENRVMQYYVKLNQEGRDKILELMDQ